MSKFNNYSGIAALTICEALLLAINDNKLLPESAILGVLEDAASTHEQAGKLGENEEMHRSVADLINEIIAGGNSVRRS